MRISLKNEPRNSFNLIKPITARVKQSPKDSINNNPFLPILNYIKTLSNEDVKKGKENDDSYLYYSPNKMKKITDNSLTINKAIFDIKRLTISHNTNSTDLNLKFLYHSENLNLNEDIFKNLNTVKNRKEPKDSIRRTVFESNNHPKDKNISEEKKTKKRYHSNKYILREINSKSPLNNTQSNIRKINQYKKKLNKKDEKNNTLEDKNKKKTFIKNEPKGKLILSDITILNQIGRGTFGKIFSVKWKKNNKIYALKKEIFNDLQFVKKRKNIIKIITDFLEKTKNKGVIKIYSNLSEKTKYNYNYYELMELGEKDWEKEINSRRNYNLYYTENELLNIASQLIRTLSLLQKNHITHRDIKPQNILIVKGKYKLCDFGEIRIMERDGIVIQRIRGSELYMSPILFFGLRSKIMQVKHNTYKSDVFSLGMCLLYAATMYFDCPDQIREMTDMNILNEILNNYLRERYSNTFISLVYLMLQKEEQLRPDFIQLEEKINTLLNVN